MFRTSRDVLRCTPGQGRCVWGVKSLFNKIGISGKNGPIEMLKWDGHKYWSLELLGIFGILAVLFKYRKKKTIKIEQCCKAHPTSDVSDGITVISGL